MTEYFRNHQWAVTDYGLESVVPGAPYEYNISAGTLLGTGSAGAGEFYDWPLQMFGKTWVDKDAFVEAFNKALEAHGKEADKELLQKSIDAARKRYP
ncbi:hypothetical protein ACC732_26425 [Rhizobium ruizarguesonis]